MTATDGSVARATVTATDGRWSLQGLPAGTYTVFFDGTETTNPQYWRAKSSAATATRLVLASGTTRPGVDARLDPRGPIRITSVTPRNQLNQVSFDLKGTGLSSIKGGFHVSIPTFFGNLPLDASSVSATRLHATGFALAGKWDVLTEWTGADGSVKSSRCVQCLHVYDPLSVEGFENFVSRGTTNTLTYFGSGLEDITRVTVSGTGVAVQQFVAPDTNTINITFRAQRTAHTGIRTVTVFRADGSKATTQVEVVA